MYQSKKLINSPSDCVKESLRGFTRINSGIAQLPGHEKVLYRYDCDTLKEQKKVALITGGGSGHEPAHAGYIGRGMLTAAVAGEIFSSPPSGDVLAAIRRVGQNNPAGVLLIVKNYTGDRLNLGIAAERARAECIDVEMVVVAEDCALQSQDKTAGRRGLCGTVFIHKIAGAMSEQGCSLQQIAEFCRKATKEMGTIGLSLSPCSLPGSGASFTLGTDEMELGLGIHGEAGVKRMKVLSAREAIAAMLDHMTNSASSNHLPIQKSDTVAVMVNNLGGTSVLEMNLVASEVLTWLENHGIEVCRIYCGSFMTSLEMAGISVTLLHVNNERIKCLDASTDAPAWTKPFVQTGKSSSVNLDKNTPEPHVRKPCVPTDLGNVLYKAVAYAFESVGNCEKQLNIMDSKSGDGDCGSTFKRSSDAILAAMGEEAAPLLPVNSPAQLAMVLAHLVEEHMGGSSGALYSLFLSAASQPLQKEVNFSSWLKAFKSGIDAIMKYGGAEPGDRTMLDALYPAYTACSDVFSKSGDPMKAFEAAVMAAENGAKASIHMKAQAGRASYVKAEQLTLPDPGAHAVGVWMRAAFEGCKLILVNKTS